MFKATATALTRTHTIMTTIIMEKDMRTNIIPITTIPMKEK
jgi:hypothetical protein